MKNTVLYLIFATVLLIQSGIIYFLMKTLQNLVKLSKENLTYKNQALNDMELGDITFKNSNKKTIKLSELNTVKEDLSFIFLSETCVTCKEIFNQRHLLHVNVKIVFPSNYSGDMDNNVLLSDDAYRAFDVKTTPQLLILNKELKVRQTQIIYGVEELKNMQEIS
ncbi:hypothetical protein A0126_18945 (plasmid) [Exiguobacterium sp. N4-1P]|uniref:hypothetical protein n=1 Tax=Exiguobacterium sp. N4-1P TaxID=2051906 RepID=UPI000B596DF6|nr:hypothetical protein [Exiguobacterium sp. N4-1P]ASI36892.1 hypothetical protein A0126_15265 [Exiguobacterium sp. N4-1P]ASI37665.1 hypothetical protein A0126_18945 [Exiguobacterium sp. N4-1P]